MRARTVLYGRFPAGLGTGLVESLSSYVARLCAARSVSVPDVFDRLVRPLVPDGLVPCRGRLSYYLSHDSVDLDGLGPQVEHYVSAFERLTDCPRLRLHTFLPWRTLFSPRNAAVVLRSGKRWCPRCFADWRQRRIELWEPLLWRVPPVRWCPQHRVPLTERCPACGRTQRVVSQTAPIGQCERCGAGLACAQWSGGAAAPGAGSDTAVRWDWWTAVAVNQMLAAQMQASDHVSPVGFAALVESARAQFPRRSLNAVAEHLGVCRSTLEAARRVDRPLRLSTFLAMCMRLGANPVEVAFAPYGAAFDAGWDVAGLATQPWPRLNPAYRTRACGRDNPERWKRISVALDALLRQDRVCSPTQFAKSLEVALGTVRRRFPDRIRQLSERYQVQRDADRQRLREQRYQAVRDAVTTLVHAGQHPSRSRTFRTAGVYNFDTYDSVLPDVWRDAVREHGLSPDS